MALSLDAFIFQYIAEGILVADANENLVRLNAAAAAMLELNPEDCLGKPLKDLFPKHRTLVRLLTADGLERGEIRLAEERLAHAFAANVDEGRAVILHDVTERYDLESRRTALISSIAHDLRNPLSGLSGYAELVEKFGDLNPQQEKFIGRIRQTSIKLYELTEKLVDLAWIEAGMPLEHLPVELASLTREVIKEFSREAQKQNVSIINSIPDELPFVIGDPKRLQQVIANLLDNAIRYSLNGGNVVIHAWHQDHLVYYTIADQGIGIMESDKDKVWARMWRSSDERVRDIAGGGIGLTFVKTLIKRQGGTIDFDSQPDEGTTFTFSLPVMQKKS